MTSLRLGFISIHVIEVQSFKRVQMEIGIFRYSF